MKKDNSKNKESQLKINFDSSPISKERKDPKIISLNLYTEKEKSQFIDQILKSGSPF